MLATILGSKVAERLMLSLYHYGEIHASGLANDSGYALSAVQSQLKRFEDQGLLVSRMVGKTRLYTFNPKSPFMKPFQDLLQVAYETLSLNEKEKLFKTRRRPRRPGKPVI